MRNTTAIVSPLPNGYQPSTKMERALRIIGVFLVIAILTLSFSFAAGSAVKSIEEGIMTGAEKLYSIMIAVLMPIAVVCFGWAAFKVFLGGTRGMEEAKKSFGTIIAVLALVYLAPLIISEVGGWFSSSSDFSLVTGP